MITLVVATNAKSICCSTLHSVLSIHMKCLKNQVQCNLHFVTHRDGIKKFLKNQDRIIFFDYGSSINADCIETMLQPLPKGYHSMVFPAVKEGVDWNAFKQKTLNGSTEPADQRGLTFDTKVSKQFGDYLWTVEKTSPSVWIMDVKPVEKLIRGTQYVIDDNFFSWLGGQGVKICACTAARCTQTYTFKCRANILESTGVTVVT